MDMDTHILHLQPPYDYIYCNGEVGRHVATLIISETTKNADGELQLQTHSYPIVKYWNSPQGVVWDKANLTDCFVLCNDTDKRLEADTFLMLMARQIEMWQSKYEGREQEFFNDHSFYLMASVFKQKLLKYGISFKCAADSQHMDWHIELGSCSEGYFGLSFFYDIFISDIVADTLQKVLDQVLEERSDWEALLDHLVKIHFKAESSLAREVNVESL